MHLLEAYAMVSGAQIDKCFIHEEPIDIPQQPYITLHSYNPKGSGRQYRYWNNVIESLKSYSKFDKYNIFQIGGSDDEKTLANTSYLGKTSYNSLAYLIKHADLHIGFDSLPVHLASFYNKKMVVLYAHYANNTRPYFSDSNKIVLLEPDHSKLKPVFSQDDYLDQINSIDYNLIINAVIGLLNL